MEIRKKTVLLVLPTTEIQTAAHVMGPPLKPDPPVPDFLMNLLAK